MSPLKPSFFTPFPHKKKPLISDLFGPMTGQEKHLPAHKNLVIWGCVITGIYFIMVDHH